MTRYIAEISSNHNGDLERCHELIKAAAECGCWGVKFQLFRIDQLFAPEILQVSETHRIRRRWELPLHFIPDLVECAHDHHLAFGCTPFDLEAVDILSPHVDFLKVASYELPWLELIRRCGATGLPLMMSCGMANEKEIRNAVRMASQTGCEDLTVFHCVSNYPAAPENCHLSAIGSLRHLLEEEFSSAKVGWSDHSANPEVVARAIKKWESEAVEFHFDLEGRGEEFGAGHCWLPPEILALTSGQEFDTDPLCDGQPILGPTPSELVERPWRADPTDGLRPILEIRKTWSPSKDYAGPGPMVAFLAGGPGLGHLVRLLAIAESLRDRHGTNCQFFIHDSPGAMKMLERHGFSWQSHDKITGAINEWPLVGLVFDQKEPCSKFVANLVAKKIPTVAIDRLDCTEADLIVVPSFGWNDSVQLAAAKELPCYGGPEYLLLRSDVIHLKPAVVPIPGNDIIVSFGAEDPNMLTERMAKALAQLPGNIQVRFVIGPDFGKHRSVWPSQEFTPKNFHLIESNDPLETILPGAGLLVTALGVTIAEAQALGVPVAVLANYESDRKEAETLSSAGSVINLGYHADISDNDLADLLLQWWANAEGRYDLAVAGMKQTDGLGASRTVDLMVPLFFD